VDSDLLPVFFVMLGLAALGCILAALYASSVALRLTARLLDLAESSRRQTLLSALLCVAAAAAVAWTAAQGLPWAAVLLVALVAGGIACACLESSFSAGPGQSFLLMLAGLLAFACVCALGAAIISPFAGF
jgi:hypothetical protein